MNFDLGQSVTGGPRLHRQHKTSGEKVWQQYVFDKKEVTGIYVGWRTYRNGLRYYEEDCGYVFVPKGAPIKVALIVEDPRKNPVPVPFDTIHPPISVSATPVEKDSK